jgi:phage-related protein
MAEAKGSLQAIGIEIGTALLPSAMKMISVFAEGTTFLTKHKTAAIALGVAIGSILVIGLAAATVAAWNFTAAILANPLTWIVIGIMAAIVALVEIGMHWRQIASWLSSAWSATIHGVAAAWHWLASETAGVWNNGIVAPLKAAWQAVAGTVRGAYHDVVNPIMVAWNGVARVTSAIWNGVAGFFRKWWPLLLVIFFPYIALLLAAWNHFHAAVFRTVSATWNAVAGFLSSVWTGIASDAAAGWRFITKNIIDPLQSAYHFVTHILGVVSSFIASVWRAIASSTKSQWHAIYHAMSGPISSAYNYVKGKIDSIRKSISSGLHGAYNDVRNIGSLFYGVGQAIVKGMVSGVESMARSLAGSVKNVAGSALNGAKRFLGINSPSRKFRDEVGQWIPAGIADGINANAHKAHDAVRSMTSGLLGASSVGGTSFGPNALALGSTGGASVVHNHVHVEVHGSVMADKDLATTVQRVMTQHGMRNGSSYKNFKL